MLISPCWVMFIRGFCCLRSPLPISILLLCRRLAQTRTAALGLLYLIVIIVSGAIPAPNRLPSSVTGSSWSGSCRSSSVRSRSSCFHSRMSSRHGSGSPDGSRRHSRLHSRSPSRRAEKDHQEEQSSLGVYERHC